MTDDDTSFETLSALFADLPESHRDAVDSAVADATDAADLRDRLTEIVPARVDLATTTESDADSAVTRIQSTVGGLRNRVADGLSAVSPDSRRGRGADSAETTDTDAPDSSLPVPADDSPQRLARVRGHARSGVADVKHTVRNADPKQAALWGLATGATLANPAIAASYSTAVLLSGAVLGGSAVGAYASSHENTIFDDLDPLQMARRSNEMAAVNATRTGLDGRALGSVLGASTYLAETLTPEEYAHWVTDVDPDLIARGAEMGVERARSGDSTFGSTRTGAMLGGGFGLAYGWASEGADDDVLEELLDSDLYEEYRRTLDET
jgi:hypothetical protein